MNPLVKIKAEKVPAKYRDRELDVLFRLSSRFGPCNRNDQETQRKA
jgi:hypothetical protein